LGSTPAIISAAAIRSHFLNGSATLCSQARLETISATYGYSWHGKRAWQPGTVGPPDSVRAAVSVLPAFYFFPLPI
jgi:hypothetical protein